MLQFVLRKSWQQTLPAHEQKWVEKALFREGKNGLELRDSLNLWWHPPQPVITYTQPPSSPDPFFCHPLLLWMPYRMWAIAFKCLQPLCLGNRLTACGLYKQIRQVLDISSFYHLATEYLECSKCHKKYIGWSNALLGQLDIGHRSHFPAIVTYRFVCLSCLLFL